MNFLPQVKAFVMGKKPIDLKDLIAQVKPFEQINRAYPVQAVEINQLSSTMERLNVSVIQMMETQGHLVASLQEANKGIAEKDTKEAKRGPGSNGTHMNKSTVSNGTIEGNQTDSKNINNGNAKVVVSMTI